MLTLTLGLVLTTGLIAKVWAVAGRHAADMGSVSHHWVIAYNASQPASLE